MIHFIKQKGQLKPLYKSDLDKWNKIKENMSYTMRYKRNRNYRHHCKLFAIARTIIANEPDKSIWNNKTEYSLIKATEMELGYIEPIIKMNGEVKMQPESIDFEHWDQTKFEQFYTDAINYWSGHFGYTIQELEENYGEYL